MVSIPNSSASLSIVVALLNKVWTDSEPTPIRSHLILQPVNQSVIRVIFLVQIMNASDFQCCLCKQDFTTNTHPRMMPHCEHSACTPCLRTLLNANTPTILCQHCGHSQNLEQTDLEYFPKNISLQKTIKDREVAARQIIQTIQTPETGAETLGGSWVQDGRQLCSVHGKELQIVCLTDKEKVCPHCALFGSHKSHSLKAISVALAEMKEIDNLFSRLKSQKEEVDSRIASKEFKQEVVAKIGAQKERVVSEIRQKFALLYENVRLAEKQAYEDVVKSFRSVYQKITSLTKEENDYQVRYKEWEKHCSKWLVEAGRKTTLQQKVEIYFDGPLACCQEGAGIIKSIEQRVGQSLTITEKLISSIRIQEDFSVANSIFNYINVRSEIDDLEIMTQTNQELIEPKYFPASPTKPPFSPNSSYLKSDSIFSPSLTSTAKRRTTPQRKSTSREKQLNRTSERKNAVKSPQNFEKNKESLEKVVQEFVERTSLDTLDLSSYGLSDSEVVDVLKYLRPLKALKGLKLVKNQISSAGLNKVLQLIPQVTNLNLSFNQLTEEALSVIIGSRKEVPSLRIINISNNKINERKAKSHVQQLRRQGIIVTI